MNNTENVKLVGELSIFTDYHKGSGKQLIFEETNLITNASKSFLLSGIYLPGIVSDPITSLKTGTGGCIDPQGLYPKKEDPTQTDLIAPIITVPTVYVLDATNIIITFLADIDQSQGNGSLISEAGLFKASNLIFNVKNHPGITKTADFSVHYSWSIRFL